MIKEAERHDEKVLTLEKPITAEVWEYLEEQVELLVNSKVRTLKTLIVPNEKAPEGAISENGASNGLNFEPYCVKLAHYSLHDEYSINTIKMLLQLE